MAPKPSDQFTLNSDGTALLGLGASTHTLRRPNIGELRKFEELGAKLRNDRREYLDTTVEEAVKSFPQDERDAEGARIRREDASWMASNLEWLREVVRALGTPDEIDAGDDELPPWSANPDVAARLVEHWLSVPLAPSRAPGRGPAAR